MPYRYPDPVTRLRANSTVTERGCWLWRGSVNNTGRPRLTVRDYRGHVVRMLATVYIVTRIHKQRMRKHHRGLHACDNARCVNPEHVSRGTQRQNVRQCVARGRHVSGFKLAAMDRDRRAFITGLAAGVRGMSGNS